MHCLSTGPKRSLLVHPSQSHQSPRTSYQWVAATWGTEQRRINSNQKKVIFIFDLGVRPSSSHAFTQKASFPYISKWRWKVVLKRSSKQAQYSVLPKHLVKTTGTRQTTGRRAYANQDKGRTLNEQQFKLKPACWHMTSFSITTQQTDRW